MAMALPIWLNRYTANWYRYSLPKFIPNRYRYWYRRNLCNIFWLSNYSSSNIRGLFSCSNFSSFSSPQLSSCSLHFPLSSQWSQYICVSNFIFVSCFLNPYILQFTFPLHILLIKKWIFAPFLSNYNTQYHLSHLHLAPHIPPFNLILIMVVSLTSRYFYLSFQFHPPQLFLFSVYSSLHYDLLNLSPCSSSCYTHIQNHSLCSFYSTPQTHIMQSSTYWCYSTVVTWFLIFLSPL